MHTHGVVPCASLAQRAAEAQACLRRHGERIRTRASVCGHWARRASGQTTGARERPGPPSRACGGSPRHVPRNACRARHAAAWSAFVRGEGVGARTHPVRYSVCSQRRGPVGTQQAAQPEGDHTARSASRLTQRASVTVPTYIVWLMVLPTLRVSVRSSSPPDASSSLMPPTLSSAVCARCRAVLLTVALILTRRR